MKQKKVMIVEDDDAIQDMMKMMFEEAGYEVEATKDGARIKAMRENFPDLLLLDLSLSGIDGKDVCKSLKTQEVTRHIPIVLVSARRNLEQISIEAGADDFLSKPFEMDELLSKAEKFLLYN